MCPDSVDPVTSLAHVLPTMQLGVLSPSFVPTPVSASPSLMTADSEPLDEILRRITIDREDMWRADEDGDEEMEEMEETTPFPHIFVIGDAADAFGAIKAGHNAYYQGEVAARNVLRMIRQREAEESELDSELDSENGRSEEFDLPGGSASDASESDSEVDLELEQYSPGAPAIKVSLGVVCLLLNWCQ